MSRPFLIEEREGGIVTLTMDRPEERNALSYEETFAEFVDACDRVNRDISVRCVILTGRDPAFCAGGNVKNMRDRVGMFQGAPFHIRSRYVHGIQTIPLALYEIEVPTIAAVNGAAIGAGCDLTCMCDIRLASDKARFAESFVKLGIVPGDGGAWLLPRVVGMSKALEMSFTGDMVDADEALACGLVSKVVPHEQLMDAARELAGRIAANPPQALRMTKRLLREGQHVRLDTLLQLSASYQAMAHKSEDHAEAVAAFFEKRPGNFTGN